MLTLDMKSILVGEFRDATQMFLKDFDAMSDDALMHAPNPAVRTVYDVMYEMVFVNRRMLKRAQQEDPGPWPFDTFMRAPAEFCNRATCRAEFEQTSNDLADAFASTDDVTLMAEFETTQGKFTIAQTLVFALMHVCHHGGQLNYIQTLFGDDQMHWA